MQREPHWGWLYPLVKRITLCVGFCKGPASKFPFPSLPMTGRATQLCFVGKSRGKRARKPAFLLPFRSPFLSPFILIPSLFPTFSSFLSDQCWQRSLSKWCLWGDISITFEIFASLDTLFSSRLACIHHVTLSWQTPPMVMLFLWSLSLLKLDLPFPTPFFLILIHPLTPLHPCSSELAAGGPTDLVPDLVRRHCCMPCCMAMMEFLRSIILGTLNSAFESGTRQDLGLEKALHVLCVT